MQLDNLDYIHSKKGPKKPTPILSLTWRSHADFKDLKIGTLFKSISGLKLIKTNDLEAKIITLINGKKPKKELYVPCFAMKDCKILCVPQDLSQLEYDGT